MKKIFLSISCLLLAINMFAQKAPSHQQWDKLLKKHVNSAGMVNYKGFIKDSVALNSYLSMLSTNVPGDTWSKEEKLAFWINAYNAFTVKLITDYYPIKRY